MSGAPPTDETASSLPDPGRVVLLAVAFEGGFALAALIVGWLIGHDPLATLDWTWQSAGIGALAALPLLPVMLWCANSRFAPCRRITRLVKRLLAPYMSRCTPLDLALVSAAAGIGEEVLFRGVLQAWAAEWLDPWIALVLASIVFGFCHAITRGYIVFATAFGLYLGGLWMWHGNLLAPIVAHAVYDFLALLYLVYYPQRKNSEPETSD